MRRHIRELAVGLVASAVAGLLLRAVFLLAMGPPAPVAYGPKTCVEWCEGEGGRAAWVRDPDPDFAVCLCFGRKEH